MWYLLLFIIISIFASPFVGIIVIISLAIIDNLEKAETDPDPDPDPDPDRDRKRRRMGHY